MLGFVSKATQRNVVVDTQARSLEAVFCLYGESERCLPDEECMVKDFRLFGFLEESFAGGES